MKKSIITVLVIVAVVILLALPKLGLFGGGADGSPTAGGPPPATVLPVEAVVVKPQSFDKKLVVTGSILANESIEVKSEVSGKVQRIYFIEGQSVNKGALLIKIDDDELRAQLGKQKFNKKTEFVFYHFFW